MADPRLRQIKIKTGVVRRLAKEKVMYEKEAKQQEEKIEKMKAEACDDYGIKKQERYNTEEASRVECGWHARNPFHGKFLRPATLDVGNTRGTWCTGSKRNCPGGGAVWRHCGQAL
ncbi:tubulin-specific chaperone A isoform X1 [Pelecanus crispus]|uniref:tubulin-specific chaperone A isoform X1 n=1 Tax=Pelecanus crispus TaxID=36300 RepID=UPI003F5D0704